MNGWPELIPAPDRRQGRPDPRAEGERWERRQPDATLEDRGGYLVLRPQSAAAREWIESHVQTEDWQWFGGRLVIDGRTFAAPIVEALREAGFTIR